MRVLPTQLTSGARSARFSPRTSAMCVASASVWFESGVDCSPCAVDQAFGPGAVEKSSEFRGIHESIDHARRHVQRAHQRRVEVGVALALAALRVEDIERREGVHGLLAYVPLEPGEGRVDLVD